MTISVSWSRAHQTFEQMRAGAISFRDWKGNAWADDVAKRGRGVIPLLIRQYSIILNSWPFLWGGCAGAFLYIARVLLIEGGTTMTL